MYHCIVIISVISWCERFTLLSKRNGNRAKVHRRCVGINYDTQSRVRTIGYRSDRRLLFVVNSRGYTIWNLLPADVLENLTAGFPDLDFRTPLRQSEALGDLVPILCREFTRFHVIYNSASSGG